jgi:hypothetical protein
MLRAPSKKRVVDQIDELSRKHRLPSRLKTSAGSETGWQSRRASDAPPSQPHSRAAALRHHLLGSDTAADDVEDVNGNDAKDIIEFTREYLHQVYVMRAKLKAPPRTLRTRPAMVFLRELPQFSDSKKGRPQPASLELGTVISDF